MRDYLSLGSTPADEDCAKVGSENYYKRAIAECTAYINQLRRLLGPEPSNTRLSTKAFPHDFGTYHEVVVYYDDDDPESVAYAFKAEELVPSNWDGQALLELERRML